MAQEIGLSPFQWAGAQKFQISKALGIRLEERFDLRPLFGRQPIRQTAPKTQLRPIPDAADQTLEGRDTGQKDLARDQPSAGPFDQAYGSVISCPTKPIEPSRHA